MMCLVFLFQLTSEQDEKIIENKRLGIEKRCKMSSKKDKIVRPRVIGYQPYLKLNVCKSEYFYLYTRMILIYTCHKELTPAPFDSSIFSKYFDNTVVFEITMVLITMRCLVATKNYDFNTVVFAKPWYFLCF